VLAAEVAAPLWLQACERQTCTLLPAVLLQENAWSGNEGSGGGFLGALSGNQRFRVSHNENSRAGTVRVDRYQRLE